MTSPTQVTREEDSTPHILPSPTESGNGSPAKAEAEARARAGAGGTASAATLAEVEGGRCADLRADYTRARKYVLISRRVPAEGQTASKIGAKELDLRTSSPRSLTVALSLSCHKIPSSGVLPRSAQHNSQRPRRLAGSASGTIPSHNST